MTLIALIRHMPTVWNAEGRLQGNRDTPLDPDAMPNWRLPAELDGFRFLSSPLARARMTAARLGVTPATDPRLGEMSWGEWEGRTLADLRQELGAEMGDLEARGLDFRAPGGESPRDVQGRLKSLFAEIAVTGASTAALTHKGVIRSALALATGWDMLGEPPCKLSWSAAHLFRVDTAGQPTVAQLNISLEA
jgi:broad specificity phosphatase PhoE